GGDTESASLRRRTRRAAMPANNSTALEGSGTGAVVCNDNWLIPKPLLGSPLSLIVTYAMFAPVISTTPRKIAELSLLVLLTPFSEKLPSRTLALSKADSVPVKLV